MPINFFIETYKAGGNSSNLYYLFIWNLNYGEVLASIELLDILGNRNLFDRLDGLAGRCTFSYKSYKDRLTIDNSVQIFLPANVLWECTLSSKFKVFAWLLRNINVDEMIQRKKPFRAISQHLILQADGETVDHLFFHSQFFLMLWFNIQEQD